MQITTLGALRGEYVSAEARRSLPFLLYVYFFTLVLFWHPQTCQHLIYTSGRAESGAWQGKLTKQIPPGTLHALAAPSGLAGLGLVHAELTGLLRPLCPSFQWQGSGSRCAELVHLRKEKFLAGAFPVSSWMVGTWSRGQSLLDEEAVMMPQSQRVSKRKQTPKNQLCAL